MTEFCRILHCDEYIIIPMKIEGISKASGARGVSKADAKKKTGDAAFGGMVEESQDSGGVAETAAPVAIARLDALLSLQEAEGSASEEAARRGKKRGAALLDELDKVRLGLLSGGIPVSTLRALSSMVSVHREQVMDPALAALLDDIDLRAQVELAKLER